MTERIRIHAESEFTGYRDRERQRGAERSGILGNQAGTIAVSGRDGFVYVRLDADPRKTVHALNRDGIQLVADLPVAVRREWVEGAPKWVLDGRANTPLYPDDPLENTVGTHASQHLRGDLGTGGFDPLEVYNRMLIQTRIQAQATPNMTVYLTAGPFMVGGEWKLSGGGSSAAFTVPADHRCDLVYIAADLSLTILRGVDGTSPAARPTVPTGVFPLAWVWLDSTVTAITEAMIEDARLMGGQTFAIAGGGHDVLSATHWDASPQVVVEDDLIVGTYSPAAFSPVWARLPKGGDGDVLTVSSTTHHVAWMSPQSAGVGTHNILSDSHTDTDAADTPAEGDALMYRSSEWVAEAGVDVSSDSANITAVNFAEQAGDPAAPAATHWKLYAKAGGIYIEDDASAVTGPLGAGGGAVATDTIWDAKGDLAAGTGANTAAKVTVGANGTYLKADSTQATGVTWDTPAGSGDVLWSVVQASQLANEIKGWPPIVNTGDLDALNLWWDKVGTPSTAPSVVAVSGEGITETFELALKVVADGAGEGLSQRWTYADEPRVKSGRVLSCILAIWSVSSLSVTAKLVNSDASETAASAVTAAAWTIVTIENHTLAGTYCDLQVTAGAGTFYVVPLGANIGSKAVPLKPRGSRYMECDNTTIVNAVDPGGANWTDVDTTANTSPLAHSVDITVYYSNTTTTAKRVQLRRNGSSDASGRICGYTLTTLASATPQQIPVDDGQIFEYKTGAVAGDTETVSIFLQGWWEWI